MPLNKCELLKILNRMDIDDQATLMTLLLKKTVFATKKEEWLDSPNEFVNMAIPAKMYEYINLYSDNVKALNLTIRELVMRGITAMAQETTSPEILDDQIVAVIGSSFDEKIVQ